MCNWIQHISKKERDSGEKVNLKRGERYERKKQVLKKMK